ncbi:MAG: dicarboxylate/amino acid:cation symporter [Burkholderiales bacterium]|nr:dicarboxylate/amino acid:cation symporter [Burkholderiales bacterium]
MATKSKKGSVWTSLPMQMMYGLILGVVVGAFISSEFATTWLQPLGTLFIRLIRMVVVPLVLATLIAGSAGLGNASKIGSIAIETILTFAVTTAIAVTIGLIVANLMDPGQGLNISTEGLQAKSATAPPLSQVLVEIVPINPVEALGKGNMLQVIFFAIMFGFCVSSMGGKAEMLTEFFQKVGDVMIKMTNIVMIYAPIGVFGLIAYTVTQHGLAVLLPLGKLILTAFVATVLFVCITYLPIIKIIGLNVLTYLKGIFEPWLIAFTTCSSAAALAVNLEASRKLGASKAIASFVIPLGNTINMNGTSIYMGVTAVFAAEVFGMDLTLTQQFEIVLMGVLAAVGTAGVPGAGLIMTTLVFTEIGIPLEAVALIAGVDRILDMIRTSVNVLGDSLTALLVSKFEGTLGKEPFETELEVQDPIG